ncbi:MAG TPA: hypothetical protein VME19_15315 [Streptosporangiaceae bacterium]|nr:hypothetical protein [Streptosporangiaceae bacterium]
MLVYLTLGLVYLAMGDRDEAKYNLEQISSYANAALDEYLRAPWWDIARWESELESVGCPVIRVSTSHVNRPRSYPPSFATSVKKASRAGMAAVAGFTVVPLILGFVLLDKAKRGREHPGMPEHELLQGFDGAGAVFPGGVDVAGDVAVLGDVVAGQAPADLLVCFRGRTPCSGMLLVGHVGVLAVSGAKRGRSASRFRAEPRHPPPGLVHHGVPRPGRARHRRQAGRDGAAELARLAGISRGLAVENGGYRTSNVAMRG